MAEKVKGTHPRFLFIKSGQLEYKQVLDVLKYSIKKLHDILGTKLCAFDLSVVTYVDRDTKKTVYNGYSYAWIEDIEVFNGLIGKNKDGTERVELIEEEVSIKDKDEDSDEEDWGNITENEIKKEKKIIKKPLPPLFEIPPYKYNEEQYKEAKLAEKRRCDYKGIEFKEEEISKFLFVEFSPTNLGIFDDRLQNSLYCENIPDWITEDVLFKYFHKYCEDKSEQRMKINGQNVRFKYPRVVFGKIRKSSKSQHNWRGENSIRNCEVIFSPINKEAKFIQTVARRVAFKNTKTGEVVTLYFKQSVTLEERERRKKERREKEKMN